MSSGNANPEPVDVFVGNAIRCRRRELGMSQEHLAAQMGISFQQVQKYERGTNRVSASMLFKAARALGVSVSSFFPAVDEGGNAETLTPADELIAATGGLELARIYLDLATPGRQSLLSVARAIGGTMALKSAVRELTHV